MDHINWYPGHMKKTKDLLRDSLKLIDIVVELLDSRIPRSSKNPDIDTIINNKPKLVLMNKSDLGSEEGNRIWKKHLENENTKVMFVNAHSPKDGARITKEIQSILKDKIEERKAKGIKNVTVRAMIVGIPNVGKSTLINSLSGRKGAKTGDRPGVTKGKQWIKLKGNIELLDTPGILWPKFEDQEVAMNLGFTGAIKDEVLDIETLALRLIERLISIDSAVLEDRYGIEISEGQSPLGVMDAIALARGAVARNKEIDYTRVANMVLDEFRKGVLGRITLELPERE